MKNQGSPQIAVDANGRLVVAYLEGSSTIWSRTRPGGSTTWSTAVIVNNGTTTAQAPSLTMRANGAGYVTWTTTAGVVWGASFNPANASWGTPLQITTTGVLARPSVALTATSAVIAAELGSGTGANLRGYQTPVP